MSSRQRFDYLMKLLLIGDSGVGKSSILRRYCDEEFTTSFITTIGIDFKVKTVEVMGKKLKLQIWDTAGQERFKNICTAYYRGAQGVFLVYDCGDRGSFQNVANWGKQLSDKADADICRTLIANKCDIPDDRKAVTSAEGKALAQEYNIDFFETSAKANIGVSDAFVEMATNILKHLESARGDDDLEPDDDDVVDLSGGNPDETSKKGGCCK